jgi:ribosomal protein L33
MSQENLVQLKNKDTGEVYWTRRNKKITDSKLELNKFSKKLKKVITFKQTKKK